MAPRRHRWLVGTVVCLLLASLVVGGWALFSWIVEPSPPSAFYQLPRGAPIGPPGSILRKEAVPAAFPGARVWRVLYASTDQEDRPIAVSGIVVVPDHRAPPGGRPVVAWAHGTSGVAPSCAPSLETDAGVGNIPLLRPLVDDDDIVVATDYPGLGPPGPHPYLDGASEGRSVLDSIRAADDLLGVRSPPPAVIMGHSQGGHAALFAAELAASYAPELDIVGVAPMSPPTDLGDLMHRDIGEAAGVVLTAYAITSWSQVYPHAAVDSIVNGSARAAVAQVSQGCVENTAQGVVDLPEVLLLEHDFLSRNPTTAPGWGPLFGLNDPSTGHLGFPMLVSQGLADTLVRPDTTIAYVHAACANGNTIQLDTYQNVGHFDVRTIAPPFMLSWIEARLAGEPVPAGCTVVRR
jgi:pimeloyl-ACP methyl ester carboxylesterase